MIIIGNYMHILSQRFVPFNVELALFLSASLEARASLGTSSIFVWAWRLAAAAAHFHETLQQAVGAHQ